MSGYKSNKYALECLRLAADCTQLSRDVADPALRSHYARMAQMWQDNAMRGPEMDAATDNASNPGQSTFTQSTRRGAGVLLH